jgi:SagB-type dehydrogenase family enzyme
MDKKDIEVYRYFLKDSVRQTIDFYQTDQSRGIDSPPLEKPFPEDGRRIDLLPRDKWRDISPVDLVSAIGNRRSRRKFRSQPLSLDELSFLLWATQGIRRKVDESTAFRTVPSAGCRHAFETYLCVLNVSGLDPGIYRYLPVEGQLLFERNDEDLQDKIVEAALGQTFFGKAPVNFIWSAIPYRMEWRYDIAAHKVIAIDAGHVCQNLYLACEAIDAGTCAVAAYNQDLMDRLLGVDGVEEFAIYMAPVGKV